MLAQQHAEIRRCHGAGFVLVRQVDKGKTCAGRYLKAVIFLVIFNGYEKLVLFRLGDFRNASASKGFLVNS